MEQALYVDSKRILATCVVHVDGKALLLHDPKTQRISTTVVSVTKDDLKVAMIATPENKIWAKVCDSFDVSRDIIMAAAAYAALNMAVAQYDTDSILDSDNVGVHKCDRASSDDRMYCFSVQIGPDRATMDELELSHVLVDRGKLIAKPGPESHRLDIFFMGMRVAQRTGVAILAFWGLSFT